MSHGGKRPGAGRPKKTTLRLTIELTPEDVESLWDGSGRGEDAVLAAVDRALKALAEKKRASQGDSEGSHDAGETA